MISNRPTMRHGYALRFVPLFFLSILLLGSVSTGNAFADENSADDVALT